MTFCIHLWGGVWTHSGMSVCPSRPGFLFGLFAHLMEFIQLLVTFKHCLGMLTKKAYPYPRLLIPPSLPRQWRLWIQPWADSCWILMRFRASCTNCVWHLSSQQVSGIQSALLLSFLPFPSGSCHSHFYSHLFLDLFSSKFHSLLTTGTYLTVNSFIYFHFLQSFYPTPAVAEALWPCVCTSVCPHFKMKMASAIFIGLNTHMAKWG